MRPRSCRGSDRGTRPGRRSPGRCRPRGQPTGARLRWYPRSVPSDRSSRRRSPSWGRPRPTRPAPRGTAGSRCRCRTCWTTGRRAPPATTTPRSRPSSPRLRRRRHCSTWSRRERWRRRTRGRSPRPRSPRAGRRDRPPPVRSVTPRPRGRSSHSIRRRPRRPGWSGPRSRPGRTTCVRCRGPTGPSRARTDPSSWTGPSEASHGGSAGPSPHRCRWGPPLRRWARNTR